jgi:hypothetical protein
VIKSTTEFRKLLPLGISTNQIIALLGTPEITNLISAGTTSWTYFVPEFPADDDMRGTYVSGLSAYLTNGRLARVAFMYRGGPTETVRREEIRSPETNGGSAGMKLFIVNTNQTPGDRFIDTPQLPKLGYIGPVPALAVNKLDELALEEQKHTDSEGKTRTDWVFQASLTPADAARFADLTRTNLYKKLLVTVGDVPVVAPMIVQAMEGGQLQIWCPESMREQVRSNLAKLKR